MTHRPKGCTEACGAITFAQNPVLPVRVLADVHLVGRDLLHPILHCILQRSILGEVNADPAGTACISGSQPRQTESCSKEQLRSRRISQSALCRHPALS